MHDVYLVDAVRTPVGKFGGSLAQVRPDDLAAAAISGLIGRTPELDPARIDDVVFGNGNGAGEENRNVARMALLLAGLPVTVPGVTQNRLCGSGLEAVAAASREIAVGDADVCLAGGVESMSRAPWVVTKPDRPYERGHQEMSSTTLGWRLINPAMPKQWTIGLGEGAEILAAEFDISRGEQDDFALASHQKATAAWDGGHFDAEVIELEDLGTDECVRSDTSAAALAKLAPVFRTGGSVTAGNSSPMNDGAAGILLASASGLKYCEREPMGRIVSRAVSGIEPHRFGLGPVEAAKIALKRAGLTWDQLGMVELNEAFAVQSIACLQHWPELNPGTLNPSGGAIALGHPVGASGARILTTLLHGLRRSGKRYGLATMCIGVGQGIAVVIEAC